MRFKSKTVKGYTIFAVSGMHSISFAIDADENFTNGLLGFSIERYDPEEDQRYFMYNMKVFKAIVPHPVAYGKYSSFDHPVQSFVWDDFTAKPGRKYTYYFHPVKGKPKNLVRETPVEIHVETEPAYTQDSKHAVFFNRGVASSQAYAREFHNKTPDQLEGAEQDRAWNWLSRDLDTALLDFIRQAGPGDSLRAAFYEFHYLPVLEAFEEAIANGVDVKIIFDAKDNSYTDKEGKFHKAFPRDANLEAIKKAHLPKKYMLPREANEDHIHHNKFIVYYKNGNPTSVWTGSVNISQGGIYGQTNVGHAIADSTLAEKFHAYWVLLSKDPGAQPGDSRGERRKDNEAYKAQVEKIEPDITEDAIDTLPQGVTPIFSPRTSDTMLKTYAKMVDGASKNACITLAFGVNKEFKEALKDNTGKNHLVFLLLESEDKANPRSKDPFIRLGWWNNVYESFGSYIADPLYQWTRETTTRRLGLNTHVAYIHSKFLLMDPLSDDPVVVSGSANFSTASTEENDENMVIIRGETRVADIYFTEFMRLFNHYYFRAVYNQTKDTNTEEQKEDTAFLKTTDAWLEKYKPGSLRRKRVNMFTEMASVEAPV